MPPSAKRGGRGGRKAVELHDASDAETPESIATPSRSSRKRGRAAEAPSSAGRASTRRKTKDTRHTEREDTEGTEAQDQSDADTEPAAPSELDIIAKLKVSDKHVNATDDFANDLLEGRENVPGYGKIAGRNWTYIIKDVEVNIGRPEQHEKVEFPDAGSSQQQEASPSHKSNISIDLGPDRQTSRLHAAIAYDSVQGQWYIIVNGRNGLRVDAQPLKRGSRAYLRSGSVVEIGGTQMAFITTALDENEGPVFADAIIRQTYASEDEDGDGDANGKTHGHPAQPGPDQRGPTAPGSSDSHAPGRVHPHSQANNQALTFAQPGTPIRKQIPFAPPLSKPSPASGGYSRGVMIESTESIDYSADSAKDLKPPHSYAQLIGMAILSTSEQQMTLNNIYKWIMANYAFYRFNTGGWQNSIRHNLSLNKAFEKIARRTDEPGKGMKWMIAPKERDTFLSQGMKGCRRPNPLPGNGARLDDGSSDPTSPAYTNINLPSQPGANAGRGKLEETTSPPINMYAPAYPIATEAYTPDRGSRRPRADNDPELSYYPPSAKSTLNHLTAAANAAGSPPTLYVNDDGRTGPLDTPFPVRSSQKLMPPSTLQRPSAFMEFSSPAPFWKFGSTPLRPLTDMSPLKTPFTTFRPIGAEIKTADDDDDDAKEIEKKEILDHKDDDLPLPPSSPPRPSSAGVDASPTRTTRPNTSHGGAQKSETRPEIKLMHDFPADSINAHPVQPIEVKPDYQQSYPPTQQSGLAPAAHITGPAPPHSSQGYAGAQQVNGHGYATNGVTNGHTRTMSIPRYETEEEDGIDLVKGFQPIGSFHKMGAARFGMGMAGPGAVGR